MHRLTAWANEGVDIHAKLPWLSAYLGHQNVIGTEVYLKATPQLLELASSRFEQHLRGAPPTAMTKAAPTGAVRARRIVLHRVSAPPTRREPAHDARLPGCAEAAVRVHGATPRPGCRLAGVGDLDADAIAAFLDHIEVERSNSAATRNCRRAAIRSFFKHLVRNDLAHSQQYTRVLAIPSKKARQRPATYLEADDVRAIIAKPDRRTADGWRDYTLLLFLYNCGARVSEATGVQWDDLQLVPPRQVRLRGKGRKERLLPLWRETADALHRLRGMAAGAERQHVFVNRQGQPLTRDGVAYILRKYASAVAVAGPPDACPQADHAPCAAPQLRGGAAAVGHRRHRDPRLSRPCQRRHDRPIHHHEPADEARCAADVLEACRHRARENQAMEAKAGPARVLAVALIGVDLCGVRRAAVTGHDNVAGGPLRIKPNSG